MNRQALFSLLLVGFGCAPGTGPSGLSCITSEDIDPLKHQPRFDPYSENRFFADRRAMRRPPRGTVPRDQPTAGDPIVSGFSNGNPLKAIPVPMTRDLFSEGKKRFEIVCAACHGLAGDGDSVVARQMQLRPPPSLLEARIRTLSEGDLFHRVSDGYGLMPAYRSELDPHERWAIVAYVRALQRSQDIAFSDAPADIKEKVMGSAP